MGKLSVALQAYEKALSFGAENSGILCGLGEVYYKLEDYSRALEIFKKALKLDSENLFALNGKGNSLCKLGKYREAAEAYETLLELDYESLPARYNRGVALSQLKHQEKSFDEVLESQFQTAFKKYVELSRESLDEEIKDENWKYRGFAFAELGEYNEALKALDNATKRDSENPFPLICKGITLICLRKYEEALETLNNAEKVIYSATEAEKPTNSRRNKEIEILSPIKKKYRLGTLRNAKGLALDALGRYPDALDAFESARKLSKNEKITCSGKGLVFAHCEEWEKTLKAFDEILALDPQDTQASIMKAFSLIRLQEFEKAITVMKELTTDGINSGLSA